MSKRKRFLIGCLTIPAVIFFCLPKTCQADSLRQISEHIYLFEDTANIYIIKAENSNSVLCIDFGEGKVLPELQQRGWVIDTVIHTHYHRDQCQGDRKLNPGTKIAIPVPLDRNYRNYNRYKDYFKLYFNDKENWDLRRDLWRRGEIYDLYGMHVSDINGKYEMLEGDFDKFHISRTPINIIPRDINDKDNSGSFILVDKEHPLVTWKWGGYDFKIYWTGGHTPWHAMIIANIDNTNYAFTGDLLYSPERILNYWPYQREYLDYGYTGVVETKSALGNLLSMNPPVKKVCPSHGSHFDLNETALQMIQNKLIFNLDNILGILNPPIDDYGSIAKNPLPGILKKVIIPNAEDQSSPHSQMTTWVIIDYRHKKSFIVDIDTISFGKRAIEEIKRLTKGFPIDAIWITHYHEDHLSGVKALQNAVVAEGNPAPKIYTTKNVKDIIEHPQAYFMPCLYKSTGIKVTKAFGHGQSFRWGGYSFTAYYFPSHTYYHGGLLANLKGIKFFFSGDGLVTPTVMEVRTCWNYLLLDDNDGLKLGADLLYRLKQKKSIDYICPAHLRMWDVRTTDFRPLINQIDRLRETLRKLIANDLPLDDPNFGFNPQWVRGYPFHNFTDLNKAFAQKVVITNHSSNFAEVKVEARLPEGWSATPAIAAAYIPGKITREVKFVILPKKDVKGRRFPLTFNITFNGKDLGELAHCLVDVGMPYPNLK